MGWVTVNSARVSMLALLKVLLARPLAAAKKHSTTMWVVMLPNQQLLLPAVQLMLQAHSASSVHWPPLSQRSNSSCCCRRVAVDLTGALISRHLLAQY